MLDITISTATLLIDAASLCVRNISVVLGRETTTAVLDHLREAKTELLSTAVTVKTRPINSQEAAALATAQGAVVRDVVLADVKLNAKGETVDVS